MQHATATSADSARQSYAGAGARLITILASALSLIAFLIYFRRGDLLLYGDAVAHINLSRRIFDSLTPGFDQLGTVWLPLPHLLMAPFVANDWLWRTGVAGAIPSMIAFVFGALGMFRLVSEAATQGRASPRTAVAAGGLAAAIYALNPNLLYLQTTAMNEPLYLALLLWAVVWLQRFRTSIQDNRGSSCAGRALVACGALSAAAEMTRYDGWFAAGFIAVAALLIWILNRQRIRVRAMALFVALVAGAPTCWLAYNYKLHGNAIDFANGPYSARAIEQRSPHPSTGPLHPGDHDVGLAAVYFLRTVEADLGQKGRFAMLLIAALGALFASRRSWPLLLLWTALPFYVYSIAYGSIPIFMPELPPWSYYNTRYGTALLPAISACVAMAAVFLVGRLQRRAVRAGLFAAVIVLVAFTYSSAYVVPHHRGWSFPGEPNTGPLVWREAKVNAITRQQFEMQLAGELRKLPLNSRILMNCADHVGALQHAGIPLRNVINDANGLFWQGALRSPANEADFVVAIAHDQVVQAVGANPAGLEQIAIIKGDPDQGTATIYRSRLRLSREPH